MFKYFLLITISFSALAEDVPGQQLLSYFSSNCKTQGEWTKSALADSTTLIETLRGLAQDPDCKSAAGSISQLELLNKQLTNIDQLNSIQVQLAEYNAKEQQLLIHLSSTTDSAIISLVNDQLRDVQLSRAALIGRDKVQKDLFGPDKGQLLAGIVQATNDTYRQFTSNQKCLVKNPSLLNTATSLVASVGATVAYVNPVLGIGLTAGAAFLGQTIQSSRDLFFNFKIMKLSKQTIAFEAYRCALETMSEKWCQMRDTESFLNFRDSQKNVVPENSLGRAIRLNDREIPVLLNWLSKIRSGVDPSNSAEATRQEDFYEREVIFNVRRGKGLGLIAQTKNTLETIPESQHWNFIRSLIKDLAPTDSNPFSSNTGPKNPFYDVFSSVYAPFMLIGLSENDPSIKTATGAFHSIDTWPKPNGFKIDVDMIKNNFLIWVTKTQDLLASERTQVLQPDSEEILSSAFDKTETAFKISPMDALKKLIEFLKNNPPKESDYSFRKIYTSTLAKLEKVYDITASAVVEQGMSGPGESLKEAVREIYFITQLEYGTVVIKSRLDLMVRLAILELMEKSPPEDQVLVAQILASERFSQALLKTSGKTTTDLRLDINNAKTYTIANLDAFARIFGPSMSDILKRLEKEENASTGTIAEVKRYARTQLCYLLMSVPTKNRDIKLESCEGLAFKPFLPGGPSSKPIRMSDFEKDYQERACTHREFIRQSKIYEVWNIH